MNRLATIVAVGLASVLFGARADTLQDATAAILRKDWPTAVRLLEPMARSGHAVAQWRMGILYYHGHGVRESDAAAREWFEKAARQGLAEAQFELANMVIYGLADVPAGDDPARIAAQWYFEAAMQGHAQAQYSLGILFLTGSGVQVSADEAVKWIGRAALQGHAEAIAYMKARPTQAR
ncbi:MAG: tetratricopeptide repeat protein [Rubrivivax sp.]